MNKTKIEWCDSTWNPVTGCLHGCEYCYARKIANRFGNLDKRIESAAEEGIDLDDAYFRNPDYFSVLEAPIRGYNGKVELYPTGFYPTFYKYRLDIPKKWSEPRTIFVCSMADLFGDWVPDEWIETVFEACAKAPQHRYLFLTKNPQRYIELDGRNKLPIRDNMWYGATASNNEQLSEAIIFFGYFEKRTKTFLSIEPILENVDIRKINLPSGWYADWRCYFKWLIIGAESGSRKDKVVPQKSWIDCISEKCKYEAGISIFMKDSLIPIVGEENMRREFPWKEEGLK